MDPKAIVAKMYEAFGKGDVATILSHVAPDCRWEHWPDNYGQKAGVPWMKPRRGPAEVAEFFKYLGTLTFHKFDVQNILGHGNQAAGVVSLAMQRPGKPIMEEEEMHLFTFNDKGQVIAFRHYTDTAKAIKYFVD